MGQNQVELGHMLGETIDFELSNARIFCTYVLEIILGCTQYRSAIQKHSSPRCQFCCQFTHQKRRKNLGNRLLTSQHLPAFTSRGVQGQKSHQPPKKILSSLFQAVSHSVAIGYYRWYSTVGYQWTQPQNACHVSWRMNMYRDTYQPLASGHLP